MDATTLAERVARYDWYHTFDLPGGVTTPGMFDHRHMVDRYLLPTSLAGMRCLDVGTMDGYWAFEMERRGAAEVVAVDIDDESELDWPRTIRAKIEPVMDRTKHERFALVADQFDSKVDRRIASVYDLDPDELGTFDVVFCGDLLTHLKNPVGAVEGLFRVCRGMTIICNPVIDFPLGRRVSRRRDLLGRRRALAEFDGIDQFQWWALSEEATARIMRAVGFDDVVIGPGFDLPAPGNPNWRGQRGILRGSAPR